MTVRSRKEKEKQFKRDYILEKATALFSKTGFENTTMSDIAKESDFAKGTLYLYFKSKEDIITEIKKKIFENLANKMRELVNSTDSMENKFNALTDLYKNEFFYKVEKFGLKDFFNNLTDSCKMGKRFSGTNPSESEKKMNDIIVEIFNLDVKLITDGKKEDFIAKNVDPVLTAFLIESLILGTSINMIAYEDNLMKKYNLTIDKILNGSLEFIISSITNSNFSNKEI